MTTRTTSVVVIALLMATSVAALPMLGGGVGSAGDGDATLEERPAADRTGDLESAAVDGPELDGDPPAIEANPAAQLEDNREAAVEAGVEEGIDLLEERGVDVTDEQREAALEGATASAAEHEEADDEQVREATKGAVHGALFQQQEVDVTALQYAVSGATDGALAQYATVEASQMQSATWGATHGALAQEQHVTVEQIQVATRGGAAGAASEAAERGAERPPKVQEAAQGAAYGVLAQYQKITVEQRQQVTLGHVESAAAGASAGALEGADEAALEVEQRQEVDVKQVQKASKGAAKGALVQRQEVTVEQTQVAARGAGAGALKGAQTVEQVQKVSVTAIQKASFGAATGAIQRQEATVEQIQAAADGGAHGTLVQRQEVSITQIQYAATGASKGAVESAIQYQVVEVEQIQAAAFGAGEGAVVQQQLVDVRQVQQLARGGAAGALSQHQEATVTQIQAAATSATQETARAVQYQRISITQLQILTADLAADATEYAIDEDTDDVVELVQYVSVEVVQYIEAIDELEGEASITFSDQDSDGDSVVIGEVSLSEGGFVAVYDEMGASADPEAVLGSSAYLEPGDHEDVTVDLEETLEESQPLVAVVHHDTTGDETFQYVETDGQEDEPYVTEGGVPVLDWAFVTIDEPEPEPEAELSVSDQTGDGETLLVDEANASVDYLVSAEYDGERVDSETFEADEPVENLELALEPPIEEDTPVDVSVRDAETDNALTSETIEYTLEDVPEPPEPEAELAVSDQTGDGETLLVDEANASIEYAVSAEYDGERVDSETFEADEPVENLELVLEPPIEEDTTVDVSVRDVETDDVLTSETIEYTLEDVPEPPEPEAELEVSDQRGDGESVTIAEANATVEYAVTIADAADDEILVETDPRPAGEAIENESFDLDTPLETDTTLEVSVVDAATDEVLASDTLEYTLDETFTVEFVDCTRAEVTDSLEDGDTVAASTGFYTAGGFGNTIIEDFVTVGEDVEAPFTGTIVFEVGDGEGVVEADEDEVVVDVGDYGDYGTTITGISSPEAVPTASIDHPNPDAEACIAETRPELPTVSVEETTVVDPGNDEPPTIDVTFGYENPNDASIFVPSALEGTTDDEPIDELEPGEGTFTVEWTPETDDERLVWTVDMTIYDYDEVLTAETEPAGEIVDVPEEPATFQIDELTTNSPVEQGEDLEVDADITNVGDEAGTQDVELAIDDDPVDSSELELEADESQTASLSAATDDLEPGEYTATVSTDDDSVDTTVTIEEPEAPATFLFDEVTTNSPVEQGEDLEVDADVTNVGDEAGTQTVELAIDGDLVDSSELELGADESEIVSLSAGTDELEPGEYTATVSTDDDSVDATVMVEEPEVVAPDDEVDDTVPDDVPVPDDDGLEPEPPDEADDPLEPDDDLAPDEPDGVDEPAPVEPGPPADEQPSEPGPPQDVPPADGDTEDDEGGDATVPSGAVAAA